MLTGAINFFIFNKQTTAFLANKKWNLLIISYLLRYIFIAIVFFCAAKKARELFIAVIAGFLMAQLIFFIKKAITTRGISQK